MKTLIDFGGKMAEEEYETLENAAEEFDLETADEELDTSDSEETNIITTFMKNFKARGGRI